MLKRLIFSILSGFILYVSWPPHTSYTFFIFFALVPLLLVEYDIKDKKLSIKQYFWYSYLSFFIFNLCTTSWIHHAHLGGAVFAILCNAFFMAFVFYLYAKMKNTMRWNNPLFLLPILWIGFEYLHLNWDLSWPWLTLGNVFASNTHAIQWYSFTGVLGGSFWILIMNLFVTELLKNKKWETKIIHQMIFLIALFLMPLFLSTYMSNQILCEKDEKSINILLVQPNIDPYVDKFTLRQFEQTDNVLNFLKPYLHNRINCVILPETFLIEPIWQHAMLNNLDIKKLNKLITQYPWLVDNNDLKKPYYPVNIFTGATTLSFLINTEKTKSINHYRSYSIYNSALHLKSEFSDSNFDTLIAPICQLNSYHKSKLVPGAEQIPFYNFLSPFLGDKLLQIGSSTSIGNFSTQDSITLFKSDLYSFNSSVDSNLVYAVAPIICYESIYGDYVRQFIQKGANVIFIITNDGWWKNTYGYQQHHVYAKLRAIETRRYIARSANTGISSIINPIGDVETMIPWNKQGVIESTLPLYDSETFYVKYGDLLGRLLSFLSVISLLYFFVHNKLISSRR